MARYIAGSATLAIALLYSSSTYAAKAIVVAKCRSYILVQSNQGYGILEWYGGNDPDKGDVVVGDLESYGIKDAFNITADSNTRMWVEEYWLSRSRAVDKFSDKCE